jgi:hypothetical protein
MAKRSLKLSTSSATNVMEDPERYNTWSNGKDTPKVTIPGNWPHKSMLRIFFRPTIIGAH